MLRLLMIAIVVCAVFGIAGPTAAQSEDGEFYAYYTRLDFKIPLEKAIPVIPYEAYEKEVTPDFDYARLSSPLRVPADGITGKYADIVVNLGTDGVVYQEIGNS